MICPWPTSEALHYCWLSAISGHKCFGGLTHQHVKKRSQGGKTVDAVYCAGGHDQVDNGFRGSDGRRLSNNIVLAEGDRWLEVWERGGALLLVKRIPESEAP